MSGDEWFNLVVIWVSLGLSGIAVVALVAGTFTGFPELRPWRAAGAVLALMYCLSYVWLAFNVDRAAEWSKVMRPVGMLSWPVVWIAPAFVSLRLWTKLRRAGEGEGASGVRGDDV